MKQEWKNIFHNKWIMVVMVAIIMIPMIYACVFLGSMWDPYGNSGDLPVAVVNMDQKVTYNDKELDVGGELVNNLKDNDSLDFHFVDEQEAQDGLEEGKYYMVMTIPENFSQNATTLLDEHPQKMVLEYTTNPGTNYIASKMDDSAIAKIKEEVSSTVTKTYAETLFDSVDTLSQGLSTASDGTQDLLDGMEQLSEGNQQISDNLKVLASSSLTFQDGSETLTQGLEDYTDGVLTIHNGIYSLKEGIETLNASTSPLQSGITQLNSGAYSLNQGLQQYVAGVNQVQNGASTLTSYNDALNQGVAQLTGGVSQLQSGTTQVSSVSQQVTSGLESMASQLQQAIPSDETLAQLNQVESSVNQLDQAAKQSQSLNTQAESLVQQMLMSGQISQEQATTLLTAYKTSDAVNSGIVGSNQQPGIKSVTNTLITGEKEAVNGLKSVYQALTKTSDNPTEDSENVGLIQASQIVDSGLSTIQQGMSTVQQGLTDEQKGLVNNLKTYTQGVSSLEDGLNTLTQNNETLLSGTSQLSNGMNSLSQSTPALVSGVEQLYTGANALYDGSTTLVNNNSTLLNGSTSLSEGAKLISEGASQLADGSQTLGEGITSATEGTNTLYQALDEGAKESQINSTDETTDMLSSPVDVQHTEISTVENNGHAMAPYMMSVALYVAALAFTLMYPIRHGIKEAKNGFKYWASKATVMYTISTLCAVVMITALRYINGFEPQQLLMTYLFAILVSAAFMSLIMLLSLTTGFIGEFLLLVFMIFNLGGSAGTYPLETSVGFFKALHPFVPYTYSVNGFRKVISMTSASLTTEVWVFIGILVISTLLTIVYYQYKNKEDKHIIPQAFEKVNE